MKGAKAVYTLKVVGECDPDKTGTKVTFKPDATIFQETTEYDFDVLKQRLREMAFSPGALRSYSEIPGKRIPRRNPSTMRAGSRNLFLT